LGDNDKNASGLPEEMIHCAECGNSGENNIDTSNDTFTLFVDFSS
jgi:hypothetical protein